MRRLALAFAVLAGCDGEGGPIPIDELQPAVVNAFCNLYVSCGLVEDQATCRLIFDEGDIDESLIAAVEAGKVIYHEDKARECLDGLSGSCERGALSTESEACDETFEGTVSAGGQCAMDEECISRTCDVPSCPDACCQGMCVGDAPIPRPTVGQSCAENTQCVASYCDFTTTTCIAHKAVGEACSSTSQCGANVCANQVCTKRPGPGEPCSNTTVGGQCNLLGYTCSRTSMTCVPYGLGGDPCTSGADCSEIYNCGQNGTCELGARLGDACDIAIDCIDRSYCEPTTMKCTAPKANGASCGDNDECVSDYCDVEVTNTCISEPICI